LLLRDNLKAYIMKSDGSYRRADKRSEPVNSQLELIAQAQLIAQSIEIPLEQRLKPMYRKEE
jgi:polyphosphate kinase